MLIVAEHPHLSIIRSIRQYLRQKMRVCRAFEVELLLTKTIDSNQAKAHERYCSTVTLPDPVPVEYDHAAIEANRLRRAVYPGSGDDVEHNPVDRTRGQLSNDPALVSYAAGLGRHIVGHHPNALA